jgi:catechol 2,3-dioxygenase-like lactoylglutathione lyase family enzyme
MVDRPVLDHFAVGVRSIDDAIARAQRGAGGREVARFSEGRSWRGATAEFVRGIRLEALEPLENPEDDFLVRFLETNGEGAHHFTFKVPDIEARIARMRALGIEPVKVNLSNPGWRECFLHPRLGLGVVIQLAQQGGPWSAEKPLGPPPDDLIAAEFLGAELRATDPEVARTVFEELLEGDATDVEGGTAYTWPGAGTLVVRPADGRGFVEAVVFRILSLPPGRKMPRREGRLYESPTRVLRIDSAEPWPEPLTGAGAEIAVG